MKVMLFGKTGQVGSVLLPALASLGQTIAPGWRHAQAGGIANASHADNGSDSWLADFRDPLRLYERTLANAPDIIVNAAAYTAVDTAEAQEATAALINAEAPAALARAAAECGALLVHYSTDYVFDGSGIRPWCETDIARPCNVYGRSKLAGDEAIMRSGCRHLIFRSSWVYGCNGSGFLQQMMQLAMQRETLSVVDDQFGAPTHARLIANVTARAILQECHDPGRYDGLYHLAAAGETNWFDYACHIFARMKRNGLELALERVMPISAQEYGSRATRPINSRLCTRKITEAFQLSLPDWQDDVDAAVDVLCHRMRN